MLSVKEYAVGLLIGIAVGSAGAWHLRGVEADRDLLALADTYSKAVIVAQDEARADERRMQREANQLAEEARKDAAKIEEKADVVGGFTGGLQHAASVYASTATCDPGVARRGEAATRAAMVLSDLFGQCAVATKNLAKSADLARQAGTTCERFADSLSRQNSPGSSSQ